jgi:hypothetical protein
MTKRRRDPREGGKKTLGEAAAHLEEVENGGELPPAAEEYTGILGGGVLWRRRCPRGLRRRGGLRALRRRGHGGGERWVGGKRGELVGRGAGREAGKSRGTVSVSL